jgi:hypothetical protein
MPPDVDAALFDSPAAAVKWVARRGVDHEYILETRPADPPLAPADQWAFELIASAALDAA